VDGGKLVKIASIRFPAIILAMAKVMTGTQQQATRLTRAVSASHHKIKQFLVVI
jgi:hypothetical protein